MGLVNKTTINFIVEQGGKLGRSLLTTKPQKAVNIEELRYMPQQLTTDVVEVTQKAVQQTSTAINPARLQELADKGLSLNQIASELNTTQGAVRFALKKNNIVTDAQRKFQVIQEYFSATTREEKAKAFAEVDKYLQEIAREEVKLRKGYSYEDCLQDVRLRFFELAERRQNGAISFAWKQLARAEETQSAIKKEMKTVSLDSSRIAGADRAVHDSQIERFESEDFYKLMRGECIVEPLSERNRIILEDYLKEGHISADLCDRLGLTLDRVRQILTGKAIPKVRAKLENFYTKEEEYTRNRINIAMEQNKLGDIMERYGFSSLNAAKEFLNNSKNIL